jgi:nucleotide-binding universal stress UspA family protein
LRFGRDVAWPRKKRAVFPNQWQAAQRNRFQVIAMKTLNIQNIVVPIDFSHMSVQAIQIAKQLARRFGASIHLAHVRHLDYTASLLAPAPPIGPFLFMPYEQDEGKTALKELQNVANECHVSFAKCDVLSGAPPFDEICRLAQTIPADLVVMPTHGRTGLKHVFLGSTAERIVQHSSCPVLVTRGGALQANNGSRFRMKTILVPVDFSKCSGEGLKYAISFANEFDAKIILLHATYVGYIYSAEATALYDIPALQKAARQSAEGKMRELIRSVNFGAVKFETALTEASPVIDICAFAKDHDVDLIITSTHGLTGFKHVLIGSIAEQVVRHAPCSVLVVPSHPHVRAANLAKSAGGKVNRLATQRQSAETPGGKPVTRKNRKLATQAFPERRKTNKFRESHSKR